VNDRPSPTRAPPGCEKIGILARTVHINWGSFDDPPAADADDDVEEILHQVGLSPLFVDLDRVRLFRPGHAYAIAREKLSPREQFRALVYLEESEAMR